MNGEQRAKRQSDETTTKKEESFEQELCKDKDAGEWFRLVAGEGDNCRDVIQCTSSVSKPCADVEYIVEPQFDWWRYEPKSIAH